MKKKPQYAWTIAHGNEMYPCYVHALRKMVIDDFAWNHGLAWQQLKRRGYRAVKIKLVRVR